MRRDILELDTSLQGAFDRQQLTLGDVEAIRLVLSGASVVDWQRVEFADMESVNRYLGTLLLDMNDPVDRERLRYVFNEAVSYLEEQLKLRFPDGMRNPRDVRQIFLKAGHWGGFRRSQILACATLKLMHVIHHMESADLKFKTAISEAELFDLAEARILRMGRRMREAGLPVVSFYGSRKSRSSIITKLLSKRDSIAATVFDKLRFRVVVERREDLIPVLAHMVRHFFPFNYVIPEQSHNNLVEMREVLTLLNPQDTVRLQKLSDSVTHEGTGKNEFSGQTYRMINFIADFPVELPESLPGTFGFELGRVVFLMIEFQLVDEATARQNEAGENAHHLYKERQYQQVATRLKRGRWTRKNKKDPS